MDKLIFECETITPMFISGADGKTPELRPPSIKAALRFWWRAMNGHLTLSKLREQESKIFGGSGEKEGKSKFNIKCFINEKTIKNDFKSTIWNTKNNRIKNEFEGLGYLFYSVMMQSKSYYERLKFNVELSSFDKEILIKIANLFIIFSFLGSL